LRSQKANKSPTKRQPMSNYLMKPTRISKERNQRTRWLKAHHGIQLSWLGVVGVKAHPNKETNKKASARGSNTDKTLPKDRTPEIGKTLPRNRALIRLSQGIKHNKSKRLSPWGDQVLIRLFPRASQKGRSLHYQSLPNIRNESSAMHLTLVREIITFESYETWSLCCLCQWNLATLVKNK